MRRVLGSILLSLVCCFASVGANAQIEQRVALVIGNSDYRSVSPLANATSDALLIAQTLKELGFTLVGGGAQLDLDKAKLVDAIRSFGHAAKGATAALFYYAGHGVQVRGINWLVPVGANPADESDVDFEMVDASLVLRAMEGADAKFKLLILDACRNNPFGSRGLRTLGRGLVEMEAPEGTLISYATQPGQVARDGDDGHSPYSKALATAMRQPGLDIFNLFNEVGLIVKRATKGTQQPWVASSPLEGTFYFRRPEAKRAALTPSHAGALEQTEIAPRPPGPQAEPSSIKQELSPAPEGPVAATGGIGRYDGNWTGEATSDRDSACFAYRVFVRADGDAVSGTIAFGTGFTSQDTGSFTSTITEAGTFAANRRGFAIKGQFHAASQLVVTISAPCGARTIIASRGADASSAPSTSEASSAKTKPYGKLDYDDCSSKLSYAPRVGIDREQALAQCLAQSSLVGCALPNGGSITTDPSTCVGAYNGKIK